MIIAAPLVAMQVFAMQARPASIEVVPSADPQIIRADIFVRRKKGGPLDDAIENVLGQLIGVESADFAAVNFNDYTADTGDPLKVEVVPSGIHIQFGLNAVDSGLFVPIVMNLLAKTQISTQGTAFAVGKLAVSDPTMRDLVMNPTPLPYGDVTSRSVAQAYHRQFRPENFTITVAAGPQFASLGTDLQKQLSSWTPPPPEWWVPDPLPAKPWIPAGKPVPIALVSASVSPKSPAFPTCLLAMIALGAGKGSLLWKMVRQSHRWSYLQEADFVPTPGGLEPVIFFAASPSAPNLKANEAQFKQVLLAASAKLTQGDLNRALAYADSLFVRGYGMNPFHLLSETDPPDPLYLDSLWRSYGADDPRFTDLAVAMRNIGLDQVRAEIKRIIDSSTLRAPADK